MYPVGHKIENPALQRIVNMTGWAHASECGEEGEDDVRWDHRDSKSKVWGCKQNHSRRFIDESLHILATYNHFNRWQRWFALYVTLDDANKQQTSVKRNAVVSQRPRWFSQQGMIIYGLTGASCRPEAFMQQPPHCISFCQQCFDWNSLAAPERISHWLDWIVFLVLPYPTMAEANHRCNNSDERHVPYAQGSFFLGQGGRIHVTLYAFV